MRGEVFKGALLVCATLLFSNFSLASSPCDQGRTWWDAKNSTCHNCTICDTAKHLTVLRPCEVHRDTLCVPIHQLNFFWPRKPRGQEKNGQIRKSSLSPTQNAKQTIVWRYSQSREEILKPWHMTRSKEENKSSVDKDMEYEYDDYNSYDTKERSAPKKEISEMKWDIQIIMLNVAAAGCFLFFVVVLSLSIYHTRQWRRLKQTLQSDVHDISAKLKLVECGKEVQEEHPPLPTNHLYSNVHHGGKDHLLEKSRKGLNNVYTQEKHAI